ncbi:Carboxypeptidase regulatory-like domain-containing protein [Pseudarcicella hirudinis]|uniref:Carboxypeptidase regulatory-like domain-containing protein n=2 Tax=Pseudarcicella hirudinis TaxID=1079859 RepID=A0A1I5XG94_9BACT|nr:carboxypeptidase regulatory-like domain-containing protein [Pseudarcicella hirudinis]SFQ30836.1 Carboxypeptidase regulatory-like domain-containing protein [Pseudarcicella hirudinis]
MPTCTICFSGIKIPGKVLFFLLLSLFSLKSFSQGTDATITGKVFDEKGELIPGATVRVKNESTGFQTGTITNSQGEYQLQQLPLGKPYSVTISFIGYQPQKLSNYALNQGDLLRIDATLKPGNTELAEVIVSANSFVNKETERAGAAIAVTSLQMKQLPMEGRNFTALTALSPLQGKDGSFSGQRSSSTNVTLDGVNARNMYTNGAIGNGPYTISQEAIREYQVSTNNYDVTQGRQGGGSLNAVTKNGTNTMEGSAFFYQRANQATFLGNKLFPMASEYNINGTPRTTVFDQKQYGFSLGGAFIKDKLHYFVAFDRQNETIPYQIAPVYDRVQEQNYGISKENLDKLIQVAREKYGMKNTQQYGDFSRETVANALFARIDWQINEKNKLTFRNNLTTWLSPNSTSDNSNINLLESWIGFQSTENSSLLSLRSSLGTDITNELKVQYQNVSRDYIVNSDLPSANIPRAIITVKSAIPTEANPNASQTKTVQFGGQRFGTESTKDETIQLANTTYLRRGNLNFKFGTDNMLTFLNSKIVNEMNGRFFFSSLQDFIDMKPSRYAREVPLVDPAVKQSLLDLAVFAQVDFTPFNNVTAMAGLRYDATIFFKQGDANPITESKLSIKTNNKLADYNNIQPRLQLTWDINGRQKDILKFGGGIFSAQPVSYLQLNNIQNSGTMVGSIDISGAGVPKPDFVSYRNNPSTAPGIPNGASYVSTINAVSDDFQVPSIYKLNLSYNRFFSSRFRAGVNLLWSKTVNNYVYYDRNIVDQPYFRLSNEGNRGVYVPAETIPANGATDWTKGRKTDAIGRVLELESSGVLNQWAVVLEASMKLGTDGYFTVSYTKNDTKDNSSFNCCVANTSTFRPVVDDPRDQSVSYSDDHFSDKLVISAATPTIKGFQLGAIFNGVGGTRYSFLVGGNKSINGDFVLTNDLAYVFDPNDPKVPESIRKGMQALLDNPDITQSVKDYIRSNVGRVAERNGGINPFYYKIDLRLTKDFRIQKRHNLSLSADCFNFLNLIDKNLGVSYNHGNINLLTMTAFDQATKNYVYNVESGAGLKISSAGGTPWRIQLGLRYSF